MQKKQKILIVIILFLLILSMGVVIYLIIFNNTNKNDTNLDNNVEMNKNENNKDNLSYYVWKCDVELNSISDFSLYNQLFIANNGELYEYSFDKKFSNDKYCKKVDTNLLFSRFLYGGIIANNGKLYIFKNNQLLEEILSDPNAILMLNPNLAIKILNEHPNVFLFPKNDNYSNPDYAYVENNKLYIRYFNTDGNFVLVKSFTDDEKYINSYGIVFKTNKSYYTQSVINEEKCTEYVDVECEYSVTPVLDIDYSNVDYFNGKHIIYKNENRIYFYER